MLFNRAAAGTQVGDGSVDNPSGITEQFWWLEINMFRRRDKSFFHIIPRINAIYFYNRSVFSSLQCGWRIFVSIICVFRLFPADRQHCRTGGFFLVLCGRSRIITSNNLNLVRHYKMINSEKLQKILSRVGIGSRRAMEQAINDGRVSVNGKIAKLGDRAVATDVIRFDGRVVDHRNSLMVACRVLAYHKPEGEICSNKDPQGRPSVYDRLPPLNSGRWLNIGRLDLNTSGLLLFTNDGELAHRLMHPSHEVTREYAVRVFGEVTDEMLELMTRGVEIDGQMNKFDRVEFDGGEGINRWYKVSLHEGHNREVRHMFEYFELKVSRLIRISYGDIKLERAIPRGGWVELGLNDVNYLRSLVDLPRENETYVKPQTSGKKDSKREQFKKALQIKRAVRRHRERMFENRARKSRGSDSDK